MITPSDKQLFPIWTASCICGYTQRFASEASARQIAQYHQAKRNLQRNAGELVHETSVTTSLDLIPKTRAKRICECCEKHEAMPGYEICKECAEIKESNMPDRIHAQVFDPNWEMKR